MAQRKPRMSDVVQEPGRYTKLHESVKTTEFVDTFLHDERGHPQDPPMDFGYDAFAAAAPDLTMDNVDGNEGFKSVSPEGDNRGARTTKPKKGDAQPGGGW